MKKKVCLAVALGVALIVALFMTSCAKHVVQTRPESMAEPEVQKVQDKSAGDADEDTRLMDQLQAEADIREVNEAAFVNENIHFGFDSYKLSDQARQILNSKADYLHMNPDIMIVIEGHCDDRGTDIYNFALGEQRAQSVKSYLVALGIGADRLSTISYGEERPIAKEHNEASWAKNRRAQFVIDRMISYSRN
jgi:peptidoglycan-associated lipoprotein